MNRSNLHPAISGASPHSGFGMHVDPSPIAAKSLFGSYAGPSPLSPSYEAQISMNETLARTRARELMQSYARDKQRTADLEQQVSRMNADNDELAIAVTQLQRQVRDLQDRNASLEESHRKEANDFNMSFKQLQSELENVTTASTHQVSDLMAQIRLREEEASHLQAELAKSREENTKLRREVAKGAEGIDLNVTSELQKAQSRSVELARRLLDVERTKRAAEDALIDDRKHHHMALNTIEQLRQQLAAAEGRLDNERRKREEDVAQLRRQLDQVRETYDQKEDAYKRIVHNGGIGGDHGAQDTSSKTNQSVNNRDGNLAMLCSTLEARTQSQQEHIGFLTTQNEKLNGQLQNAIRELQTEKAKRVEEVTKAQETIRGLKDDGTRRELAMARKDKERVVAALTDLKSLYEDSIQHFASIAEGIAAPSDVVLISRTLQDIDTSLRKIISSCQASGDGSMNEHTERLMERLVMQMESMRSGGGAGGGGGGGHFSTSNSTNGSVAPDEYISDRDAMALSYRNMNPNHQSLASHEYLRQIESLKKALDESERSKHAALAERDRRDELREQEVRSQLEQLVAHTQRLQRQAALDAEDLENARQQLQIVEANATLRITRTRRECARSIDNLHTILKQIEAEHQNLITRRYSVPRNPVDKSEAAKNVWRPEGHVYQYANTSAEQLATGAEIALGDKIKEALQQQEALMVGWLADDARNDLAERPLPTQAHQHLQRPSTSNTLPDHSPEPTE